MVIFLFTVLGWAHVCPRWYHLGVVWLWLEHPNWLYSIRLYMPPPPSLPSSLLLFLPLSPSLCHSSYRRLGQTSKKAKKLQGLLRPRPSTDKYHFSYILSVKASYKSSLIEGARNRPHLWMERTVDCRLCRGTTIMPPSLPGAGRFACSSRWRRLCFLISDLCWTRATPQYFL